MLTYLKNRSRINLTNISGLSTSLTLCPEAATYQARVVADGGTVVSSTAINEAIRYAKTSGIYDYLTAWYSARFGYKDAGSGLCSKWYDLSANNNDAVQATGANQPVWTSGEHDGSKPTMYFDANHFFTVAQHTGFNFGTGDFTIFIRVKWFLTAPSYQNFIGSNNGSFTSNAGYFRVWGSNLVSRTWKVGGGTPSADPDIVSNNGLIGDVAFSFLEYSRGSGTLRIFSGGFLSNSKTSSINYDFSYGSGTCIGKAPWDGTDGYFKGYISELCVLKGLGWHTGVHSEPEYY
jgi:hypothetical protein